MDKREYLGYLLNGLCWMVNLDYTLVPGGSYALAYTNRTFFGFKIAAMNENQFIQCFKPLKDMLYLVGTIEKEGPEKQLLPYYEQRYFWQERETKYVKKPDDEGYVLASDEDCN